jgi:hypothetical protein
MNQSSKNILNIGGREEKKIIVESHRQTDMLDKNIQPFVRFL